MLKEILTQEVVKQTIENILNNLGHIFEPTIMAIWDNFIVDVILSHIVWIVVSICIILLGFRLSKREKARLKDFVFGIFGIVSVLLAIYFKI